MSRLTIVRLLLFGGLMLTETVSAGAVQREPDNQACIECHAGLDDRLADPVTDFETDVHSEHGFGCLDCHGQNPATPGRNLTPQMGFLAGPTRAGVIAMCTSCHSNAQFMRQYNPTRRVDQGAEYATSVHGTRLAQYNDPNVAVCVSCHPAHRIRPPTATESSVHPLEVAETCGTCHADQELMAPYGIPTDQLEEYERSIHWQWMVDEEDLSAPTCNDCHGNHGAAPPGVSSVANVCGQCHTVMAGYFEDGPHDALFDEAGLPGCATCHGNHEIVRSNDEMLIDLNESVCLQCHTPDEDAGQTFVQIHSLIDSLEASVRHSEEVLGGAENLGMEVSQAQFDLEEANTALVRARTAIHAFDVDSVRVQVDAGMSITTQAADRGQDALDEHRFRRQGLAVSVFVILLLIASLGLQVRRIEQKQARLKGESKGSV